MEKKRLGPEAALQKLRHYCAYQDRCHKEVKEKLFSYGVYGADAERLISTLIEDEFLNEERYACSYARGHFRMRQWGRARITYELKQKGISTYCIQKAMKEIPEDSYLETLQSLMKKKAETLSNLEKNYDKRQKIAAFLIQKGYEFPLVQQELGQFLNESSEK
jgi:regulatory protein